MSDDSVQKALRQVKLEGRTKDLFDEALNDQEFMDTINPGRFLALIRVVTRAMYKRKHYKNRVPDDIWDAMREVEKEVGRQCECGKRKQPQHRRCQACSVTIVPVVPTTSTYVEFPYGGFGA